MSNSNAQLTYKVGLMSYPEMLILGNSNARNTGQSYWLASPMNFYTNSTSGRIVGYSTATYSDISSSNGVRPAISLGDNAKYRDGDGSMANPYIVITE